MDITTTTVTTKTHRATVSLDGLKNVAIAAAKIQLGLIGETAALVIASEATANEDGSISIEIVEKAGEDADKPIEAPAAAQSFAESAPSVAEPAAAPTLHAPSFAKVA